MHPSFRYPEPPVHACVWNDVADGQTCGYDWQRGQKKVERPA